MKKNSPSENGFNEILLCTIFKSGEFKEEVVSSILEHTTNLCN